MMISEPIFGVSRQREESSNASPILLHDTRLSHAGYHGRPTVNGFSPPSEKGIPTLSRSTGSCTSCRGFNNHRRELSLFALGSFWRRRTVGSLDLPVNK